MGEGHYTNADLGRDYVMLVSRAKGANRGQAATKRRISSLDVDLTEYYKLNENLKFLESLKFGREVIKNLELILGKGFKEADRILEQEKIDGLNLNRISGLPLSSHKG